MQYFTPDKTSNTTTLHLHFIYFSFIFDDQKERNLSMLQMTIHTFLIKLYQWHQLIAINQLLFSSLNEQFVLALFVYVEYKIWESEWWLRQELAMILLISLKSLKVYTVNFFVNLSINWLIFSNKLCKYDTICCKRCFYLLIYNKSSSID